MHIEHKLLSKQMKKVLAILGVLSMFTLFTPVLTSAQDETRYELHLTVGKCSMPADELGLPQNPKQPVPFATVIQTEITEVDSRIQITNIWFELVDHEHVYARARIPINHSQPDLIMTLFPGAHEEMQANVIVEFEVKESGERLRRSTERGLSDTETKPETPLDDIFVPQKDHQKVPALKTEPEQPAKPEQKPETPAPDAETRKPRQTPKSIDV